VERSTASKCIDFRAKVAGVSQSLSKPPQRIVRSGFEIDCKCKDEFLAQFFTATTYHSKILSLHILYITAHFTFIAAQMGYHFPLKLCMYNWSRSISELSF
jgi:hypothetical protein